MTTLVRRAGTVAVAVAAVIAGTVSTAGADPVADEVEPGWVHHHHTTVYVDTPNGPADGPSDSLPDATIYLIAPLDPTAPQDPGIVLPLPDGSTIVVPVHDTVVDRPHSSPADCFGVQVVPGPRATPSTVLTRPDPNGGATLAYAVKLGPFRITLNGEGTIRLAERLGLVTLDRTWPGYGGRCWTGSQAR